MMISLYAKSIIKKLENHFNCTPSSTTPRRRKMGSRHSLFPIFFLLVLSLTEVRARGNLFNILQFGGRADQTTDNSKAISSAWNLACESPGTSMILIPRGTYMVRPLVMKGPCKGPITFQHYGALKAFTDLSTLNVDHWITFQYIDGLTITGGGSFDGQGASAWPLNSCSRNSHCKPLPISLRFDYVNKLLISYITSINSKNFHMNIFASHDVRIENIKITAPEDSPNTDGIHVATSTNVHISNANIGTGDDCISMGPGLSDVTISNVQCGPGHGISVGSLGGYPNEGDVKGVVVSNCTLIGTMNGVRIKTKAPSYQSTVSDITFEQIRFINVRNPIIIDQQYCPSRNCGQQGASLVELRDIKFRNIYGTSNTDVAVNLQCSQSRPCQQLELSDINIAYQSFGKPGTSSCSNAHGVAYGQQHPPSCL